MYTDRGERKGRGRGEGKIGTSNQIEYPFSARTHTKQSAARMSFVVDSAWRGSIGTAHSHA